MVVGHLVISDHQMMREHTAHGFVETAADGFFRHFERRESLGASGMELLHRLLDTVEADRRRISLEIGAGAIALDGVAPLGNFPFEFDFGLQGCLGQPDFDAVASGLDVADVHQFGEGRCPETGDGTAAGVERQMIAGALVEPARRHDPGVLAVEIALLRFGNGGLVPGMPFVHRVSQRIMSDEGFPCPPNPRRKTSRAECACRG